METSVIKNNLKNLQNVCTPTGDIEADKARAKRYAEMVGMDSANTKMMEVTCTQGMDAAAKAMVSEFTNEKEGFDYCAMRARYG